MKSSDATMETVDEQTGIQDDSGNTVTVTTTTVGDTTPGCTLHHLSELMSTSTAAWNTSSNVAMATMSGSNGTSVANNAEEQQQQQALTRRFEELYVKDLRLRSGSFGTVYTCHHRTNEEVTYAVKIMDRKKLKQKDVTAVFREVKIMGELSHSVPTNSMSDEDDTNNNNSPHYIVQLVDFFVEPGSLYVVQEYAAGGDLFDRLTRRQHYTEQTARDVARQLLETIQFLHSRNPPIVHRDIKPENLLLKSQSDDAHILVADFGFARHVDPIQKCQTRCGTPSFVAPEILIGLSYEVTVDLWSVGCLLYMLVAGYTPFQAPHHRGLFRKIRAGDFIFHEQGWGNVSVESKRLISNLLTVNMDLRWTAERALQCAWFQDKKLEERLSRNDLSPSLVGMKQFVPKDAWKRAFHALGFCASAPFWDLDHSTFSQQMSKWDQEASAMHTSSSNMIHRLPKIKFSDRYELQKKIRKGSYATVWECIHKTTKELYAVKVIQRKGLKPEDDENVLNEVAVMQSLSADANKFVVQLLDFYEEDEYFYLVMEYCSGGDVFDRIVKYVQYTEMDARNLAITLLRAVQSIHATGLAHRDIKPQNLFLLDKEDNASIRVGDFGFSKRVHTPESLTSRVGTPTYVAPEILKNLPHDERVDLWSVGIVIFVLLVGYPPFLDEDQSVLFKKIRTGEWVFFEDDWANISEEAKELIRGLLVVDPKERWTIEQCLTCEWIDHDPAHLSNNDLTDSIRKFKEKKHRLRGVAVGFKGMFDNIKAYALATSTAQQAQ